MKLKQLFLFILLVSFFTSSGQNKPNYVFILMDDMGYKDIHCYGGEVPTPNIDKLAEEGIKFTNFYAAANVCSPSRAGLLTGLYPNHSGVPKVLFPNDKISLPHNAEIIPQYLNKLGYASGIVGKWHLGDKPETLPLAYGFSFYYGLPYSNDMLPSSKYPDLPMYLNDKIAELNPDQSTLTTKYTEQSINFINRQKEKPFFLYLAHSMPHVPLAVSGKFKNKSGKGLYGDVIMELDWSVGELVKALKKSNQYENTIIMISSDNGPWLQWGNWGGNSEDFREGKFTTFDGGHRVPFIIKGLGHQKNIDAPAVMIDVFPTLAQLSGGKMLPKTDGQSLLPLIKQNGKAHEARLVKFYSNVNLQAIRFGDWKYHTEHRYKTIIQQGVNGVIGKAKDTIIAESLFNIKDNPEEDISLNKDEVKIEQMRKLFKQLIDEI